ncbi:hypothetical protein LguiB_020519 [Lonicera macranthoides]
MALKSKSNGKYLHYVVEDVQVPGILRFSGEEVGSPYAKYEVEIAKSQSCLRTSDAFNSCIYAGCIAPDQDHKDVFSVIDWESLLILPKHVAFKGPEVGPSLNSGHSVALWQSAVVGLEVQNCDLLIYSGADGPCYSIRLLGQFMTIIGWWSGHLAFGINIGIFELRDLMVDTCTQETCDVNKTAGFGIDIEGSDTD